MIRKIHLFITAIAVVVGSCKDVDKKVIKQEAALPIQPNVKPVDSSQVIVGSPEVQDYKDRLHYIVERMNKSFGKVPTTGNPEDDFSKLMITNQFAGNGQRYNYESLSKKEAGFPAKTGRDFP